MKNSKVQMATVRKAQARLQIAAVAAMLLVLSGCGGGGGDEAPAPSQQGGNSLTDLFCALGMILAPFGGGCVSASSSGSSSPLLLESPSPTTNNEPQTVDLGPRVDVASFDVEPNDELANASVLTFVPARNGDGGLALETTGLLRGQDMELGRKDVIDTYIFTAPRALELVVQLCYVHDQSRCDRMTAEDSIYVGGEYFEVLDQFGNVLGSTQGQTGAGNLLSITVDGGVPYYIRVVATAQMTWLTEYYLRATSVDLSVEPPLDASAQDPAAVVPSAPELWITEGSELMVTLNWMPPMTYTDGSALANLQGYVIYVGEFADGPYTTSVRVDAGLSSYMLTLPDWGLWHIAIAAIDAAGVEGVLSNEVAAGGPPPDMP